MSDCCTSRVEGEGKTEGVSNVSSGRTLLQQKADAARIVLHSITGRDIISIQRDLPFMLIGHQQEGGGRQRWGLRWSDRRPKEQWLHVSAGG